MAFAVDDLPVPLRGAARARIERWREAAGADAGRLLDHAEIARSLPRVFACSDFVAAQSARAPRQLTALLEEGSLLRAREPGEYTALFAGESAPRDSAGFMRHARQLRQREWCRIAWRDLAGWAELEETLGELSDFADAAIAAAQAQALEELRPRHGRAIVRGEPQPLLVLGMGKLGGRELNFSSDIDLIFLFAEPGESDGPRPISHEEYYTRVGRRMIQLLDAVSEDGFVFRVDMRLRPYGDSGPLAMSFAALETYLQQQGREWERYAYVKARPITAVADYAELYRNVLRPFVFRRYLDYGVFDSLRQMKALVSREVERRDLKDNVKLGPGGIREIEFIAQALQLVRGGAQPELQRRGLLDVLPRLEAQEMIRPDLCAALSAAYRFLRRVENRLQEAADRQVHELPQTPLERLGLAFAMGFESSAAFDRALDTHRRAVSAHFQDIVFGPASEERQDRDRSVLSGIWEGSVATAEARQVLEGMGIEAADETLAALARLREGPLLRRLDETGRKRLDALVPRLLAHLADLSAPAPAIDRLIRIIEAIGGRTAYLSLLNENREALQRLTGLCADSDFLAQQVAAHPLLTDELLDPRIFEEPPSRRQFTAELQGRLHGLDPLDLERRSEALIQFQRAAKFHVALADLSARLPVMKVSDRLTDVAELVLGEVLETATRQMAARHGRPIIAGRPVGFAIVGYGKLGGLELGYGSDLDLVFLHEAAGASAVTDGERPIDHRVWFARLGQRIVSLLGLQTSSGALYETDMRLRPSGRSGPLVSSLAAFRAYQREQAWTWEHQALLRARSVAGEPRVRAEFERIRAETLQHDVRRETLAHDVRTMRDKMRRELSAGSAGHFDLKQDPGGLTDIEFLVQYWVLRWTDDVPELAAYTDNIRQLATLAVTGCIPVAVCDLLADVYRRYRERLHRLSLQDAAGLVAADDPLLADAGRIAGIWAAAFDRPAGRPPSAAAAL